MTRPHSLAQYSRSQGDALAQQLRESGLAPAMSRVARAAYAAGFDPVLGITGPRKTVNGLCVCTPQAWFPKWLVDHAESLLATCLHEVHGSETSLTVEVLTSALRVAHAVPEVEREARLPLYVQGVRACLDVGGIAAAVSLITAEGASAARRRRK